MISNLRTCHTTATGSNAVNTTTTYLYSGDALIAEYVGSTMTRHYVHGNGIDNPLVEYHRSTTGSTNRYYLHSDHQDSITALNTNPCRNGTLTRWKYRPDSAAPFLIRKLFFMV